MSIFLISIGTATTCSFTPQLNILGKYGHARTVRPGSFPLQNTSLLSRLCIKIVTIVNIIDSHAQVGMSVRIGLTPSISL
jgi:hypothetical protein